MKILFKTLVLFSTAFPALCFADSEWKDFPAIFKIQVGKHLMGTAFAISPKKIVTAFHVISKTKDIKDILIHTSSGKQYPVKAIRALDALNDLAVLDLDGYELEHHYIVDHSISVEHIETAGFPAGKFQYSHGNILPQNWKDGDQYLIFQKSLTAGTSGAPIFKGDKLIAVFTGGFNYNMAQASSVNHLRQMLSKPFIHCKSKKCIKNAIEKEINKTHQLAEEGDRIAQFRLGRGYIKSLGGFTFDLKKGVAWLEESAKQGYPTAQMTLAEYKKSLERGWQLLQHNPSTIHANILETQSNSKKIFEMMKSSAEQGFAPAQRLLSKMYAEGWGVEKDLNKSFELMEETAKQGLSIAQFELARMHEEGLGTTQNPEKALYWYTSAAKQDFEPAIDKLKELSKTKSSCRDVFQKKGA